MAEFVLTQNGNVFVGSTGKEVTISVRSASGNVTLATVAYPDPKLKVTPPNAVFKVVKGANILTVTATAVFPMEDWTVVEVADGEDNPLVTVSIADDTFTIGITLVGQ